jgi:N-acylmannosamine kinase
VTGASERLILALDIGGTKIAAAIVKGASVIARRQAPSPRGGVGDDLVEALASLAEPYCDGTEGLAVATTGIVDAGCVTAINPNTLPIEDRYPLAERLSRRLARDGVMVNDAHAAAWGEFRHGAGRGTKDFAFLTISTGIGGGLVLNARLIAGRRGIAGHFGHVLGDPLGSVCGCGRTGCVEALASGAAIAKEASARLGQKVDAVGVFERAAAGDALCEEIIDRAAVCVSRLVGDLVAALDVELIAIGGGVGLASGFFSRVRRATQSLPLVLRRTVTSAALGADAGLIGAAALAQDGEIT